ncbi:MAG: pseudouridine-5'-phosphate glycosidase, partial [FCB group bacterium]|nr:pseudouridine-5'-phosphate glycosidase [FCB group bacterium]
MNLPASLFRIHPEIKRALQENRPVLALESTIIAHGMPYPQNLEFARQAESLAKQAGVEPATIALIDGYVHIGLEDKDLTRIAKGDEIKKVTARDLGTVLAEKATGATTVSATLHLAHLAGIKVFATGGIGGVHRHAETSFDISQDLYLLRQTPMVVVTAGAKAILDIPKTLELLETLSVAVVGYGTNDFPAFYSRRSGCVLQSRAESAEEVARIFTARLKLHLQPALLVANPVPAVDEIPQAEMRQYIHKALKSLEEKGVSGKSVTPFLLQQIVHLTKGRALKTNISLALN